MKKNGVSMTVDRVSKVLIALGELPQTAVLVGVPEEKTDRKAGESEEQGPTNAMIGYVQENGSPAKNIPARPHLIPGIRAAKKAIDKYFKAAGLAALKGNRAKMRQAYHAAGLAAQSSVKATLTAGEGFQPLAPATLAARRARGRKGTRPLIDTGQYRNSITHVLRKV